MLWPRSPAYASAAIGTAILRRANASQAFAVVAVLTFIGCLGFAFPIPWAGLLLVAPFWLAMRLLHFFLTHFLNPITPAERRATVLSFRGVTMNLAYGGLTLAYGAVTAWLDGRLRPALPEPIRARGVRRLRPFWTPWFLVAGGIVWLVIRLRCGGPLAQRAATKSWLWNLLLEEGA